jgi:hypothetical protein
MELAHWLRRFKVRHVEIIGKLCVCVCRCMYVCMLVMQSESQSSASVVKRHCNQPWHHGVDTYIRYEWRCGLQQSFDVEAIEELVFENRFHCCKTRIWLTDQTTSSNMSCTHHAHTRVSASLIAVRCI